MASTGRMRARSNAQHRPAVMAQCRAMWCLGTAGGWLLVADCSSRHGQARCTATISTFTTNLPFLVISSSLLTDRLPVCSGATWSLGGNPGGPKLQNGGAGENSITRFNNGSWDGYIMMMRCENEKATPGCKDVYASISFSKDLLTWTPRTPVPGLNPWIQVRSRSFLAIFCHVSVNVPAFPLIFLLASPPDFPPDSRVRAPPIRTLCSGSRAVWCSPMAVARLGHAPPPASTPLEQHPPARGAG